MVAPLKNQSHVPQRKRWTVGELLAMDKAGLLDPEKHVELIDGEVYEMAIGEDHADVVDQFNEALVAKFAGRARVRVQNPVFSTNTIYFNQILRCLTWRRTINCTIPNPKIPIWSSRCRIPRWFLTGVRS